jgi:charged multivesicular body protein 4A/B
MYEYISDPFFSTLVGAVSIMKKRKLYQAEADKISNIKMTLETQAIHLESAASSAEAFHAMSAGNRTMKKIRNDVGVDQVDDMMVDIQEEMQMAEEVNTAMGQAIDPLMGAIDDDELMKELEDMGRADLQTRFDSAEANRKSSYMPQVPSSGLSRREEEDYRRLQAELAM